MIQLLNKNLKTLIGFDLLFSLVVGIVIVPALQLLFKLSLKLSGIKYLTQENIRQIAFQPVMILIGIVILFIITIITVLDINAIIILYMASKQNQKMNLRTLVRQTLIRSKSIFRSRNILLFAYISLLLPYAGLAYSNPIIASLEIPGFVLDGILKDPILLSLLVGLTFVMMVLSFFNVFLFFNMLIKKQSFFGAVKLSFIKVYRQFGKVLGIVIKYSLLGAVIGVAAWSFSYLLYYISTWIDNGIVFLVVSTIFIVLSGLVKMVADVLIKAILIFGLAEKYFAVEPLPKFDFLSSRDIRPTKVGLLVGGLILLVSVGGLVYYSNHMIFVSQTKVMAHRGSSIRELENSKEAILLAVEEGAAYVELDVVETKDKQVVVIHDLNLKRLAGLNKAVGDMTWAELADIKLTGGQPERQYNIIRLQDLLPLIGENTILNVEIKPNKTNSHELAELVEGILAPYPRHMVCSLNKQALIHIKKINPQRLTGYILAIALGDYKEVSFADFYSIEEKFVSQALTAELHDLNKHIYVWTINDMESVAKYYDMDVDGIITDYPLEVSKALYEAKLSYRSRTLQKLFLEN